MRKTLLPITLLALAIGACSAGAGFLGEAQFDPASERVLSHVLDLSPAPDTFSGAVARN
jgi:hypothetical protein